MSLIMDALEKIQRDQQEPKESLAPVQAPAAGTVPLDPFEPQPFLGALREWGGRNLLERRWVPAGFGAILVLGITLILFQQSALQFMPAAASSASLPGTILQTMRMQQGILRGIVQDPAGGFCLIGNRVLKKGDIWRDYQVVSIGLRQVTLKNEENRFLTLSLPE